MNTPLATASGTASATHPRGALTAAATTPAVLPVLPRPCADDFDAVLHHGAYMPLTQFGVIDATGDDAASFLHGQLTNDTQHLDAANARLAGYCSAKGRLLASFLTWRSGETIRLLASKDVQAAVQKRLSMFVLRAKAKLVDASGELAVVGLAGDVRKALSGVFDALPDGVHVKVDGAAGSLIRVPDALGRLRFLWIGPKAAGRSAPARARRKTQTRVAGRVGLARHSRRRTAHHAAGGRAIRAANGQFRCARRGKFPQRLLSRPGSGGAQPVSRHDQAAHVARQRGRRTRHGARRRGTVPFGRSRPAVRHGRERGVGAGRRRRCAGRDQARGAGTGSVHLGAADGPALRFLPLPYGLPTEV